MYTVRITWSDGNEGEGDVRCAYIDSVLAYIDTENDKRGRSPDYPSDVYIETITVTANIGNLLA